MIDKNTTLFISDLHLDAKNPRITAIFFRFLEDIAIHANSLYILGDFFETYIGDDDKNTFLCSIKNALSKASQHGLRIFFMHGNRDFLLGKTFAAEAGITLLSDPTLLTLHHQKIVLMHGDSLCTKDKKYQLFRKLVRNTFVKKAFLLLPLAFRQKIANDLRKESAKHTSYKSLEMMNVANDDVLEAIEKHQASILIHGHTHKPAIHSLDHNRKRIVLSAWHDAGHYLAIDRNGNFETNIIE